MNPFGYDDDEGREGEEFAQVDGDSSGAAQFVPGGAGQPWLRGGMPPWHMWGNTQVIDLVSTGAVGPPPVFNSQQLCRVNYGRPESWHWIFMARILNASDAVAPSLAAVVVVFDLIIGVGRSNIQLPDFETFVINYPGVAPRTPFYSTQAIGPNRTLTPGPGGPIANLITEFPAQDIQVATRTVFAHSAAGEAAKIEVSAHFAPKNHIRPDWFRDGPPELQYGGAEIEGR